MGVGGATPRTTTGAGLDESQAVGRRRRSSGGLSRRSFEHDAQPEVSRRPLGLGEAVGGRLDEAF